MLKALLPEHLGKRAGRVTLRLGTRGVELEPVRTLKIIEDLVGCNHGISLSEIPILHMRDACFWETLSSLRLGFRWLRSRRPRVRRGYARPVDWLATIDETLPNLWSRLLTCVHENSSRNF